MYFPLWTPLGNKAQLRNFTVHNSINTAQTSIKGCDALRRIFIVLLALLLTGCTYYAPPGESHASRVITAIEVTASESAQLRHYRYTTEEKMQAIMNYLRRVRPDLTTAISPDTFRTDAYRITLYLSDGTQTVYHQLYSDYLQKDGGLWRSIDAGQGAALSRLLHELPPDM